MISKPSRELHFLERQNLSQSSLKLYANFAITAQYNKEVTPELLSNALKRLIERNLVLASTLKRVVPGDDKHGFKNFRIMPVDIIEYHKVVTVLDREFNESELEFINEQHCLPNQGNVIWRILVYSNNYITMYTDHTLFDGESGKVFHKELNEIFYQLTSETKEPLEFEPILFDYELNKTSFKLGPKISEICDIYDITFSEKSKLVMKELLPGSIKRLYYYLTDANFPNHFKYPFFKSKNNKSPKTHFNLIHVDNPTMQQLLGFLRQQGLTLSPFLSVLLNYCFHQTILPDLCMKPMSTRSNIVLSGRRMYPHLYQELKYQNTWAACISDLGPVTELNDEILIKHLKRIGNKINNTFKNRKGFKHISLLQVVNPYEYTNVKQPYWNQDLLFEFSNLGYNNFKVGDGGSEWQIKDLVFSQTIGYSCTFGFSVISSPKGLNISFSHLDDIKFRHLPTKEFMDLFHETIAAIIQKELTNSKESSE